MAASPDYQSVQDEFGMPRPNFIVEELEEGQRRIAEAQEKERAVEQMKEALR